MARRNISLPDELAARLERHQHVNWSAVAQDAWKALCDRLEGNSMGNAMGSRLEPGSGISGADRAARFREQRLLEIDGIMAGSDSPIRLRRSAHLALHVFPVDGELDIGALSERLLRIPPFASTHYDIRFNVNGACVHNADRDGVSRFWFQYFTTGAFEAVETSIIGQVEEGGPRQISSAYEPEVVTMLRQITTLYREQGINPPFFAMLSLRGIRGVTIAIPPMFMAKVGQIAENDLILPPVRVESLSFDESDPRMYMKPVFDTVARAAGLSGSVNYSEDGSPDRKLLPPHRPQS